MDNDVRRQCAKVRCAFFHLLLLVGGATGLSDLTINAPAIVRSGDTVTLSCHYDLEGSSLYTIQWSFEDTEFYRVVPERSPSYTTFIVDGMHVNISKSNMHDVTLMNVSRKLSGVYKCEVSAGSPSYHTLIKRARMEVVDAPETDPTIGTEKERITVDETLQANCTTGTSRPASTITWKLNEILVANNSMQFQTRYYVILQEDGSERALSTIAFKVTSNMFRNGRLHLRCIASIADVYRKSVDIDITEDAPRIASIKGESPPHGHRSSACPHTQIAWTTQGGLLTALGTMMCLVMTTMIMTVSPTSLPAFASGNR